jgi:hypothetical protein
MPHPSTKTLEGNLHNSNENVLIWKVYTAQYSEEGEEWEVSEELETMSSLRFECQLDEILDIIPKVFLNYITNKEFNKSSSLRVAQSFFNELL